MKKIEKVKISLINSEDLDRRVKTIERLIFTAIIRKIRRNGGSESNRLRQGIQEVSVTEVSETP